MFSTVAVEVAQGMVPADGDTMARPVPGWFHRCPETLEVEVDDTSLPHAGENAADLPRPAPHRDSERWG
jgi:hypothetical protein